MPRRTRRGASLVIVLIGVTAMFAVSYALWSVGLSLEREQSDTERRASAHYAAEAGMSAAFLEFEREPMSEVAGILGSFAAPLDFAGTNVWVERLDPEPGTVVLRANGIQGRRGAQVELMLTQQIDPLSIWAAFGDEGLTMDSNAFIDSYDSSLGSYSSQRVNGNGSNAWAKSGGHAGSNVDIGLRTNAKIHGNASPGPDGTASIIGNAFVTGSTAPSTEAIDLPPLDIPSLSSSGDWQVAGTGSTVGPGNFAYDDLVIDNNAQLTVVGPATIVVDSLEFKSNGHIDVDASNGDVVFYVRNDFVMNSNTRLASTTFDPRHVSLFLDTNNIEDPDIQVKLDALAMDSNAKLFATLYAPNAFVEIKSNFELFGALIAKRVHLDSNSKIHFDEALMAAGDNSTQGFQVASWVTRSFTP